MTEGQTPSQLADMPFELDQCFYSRTDKRGVIAAGNSVFQRISGFEWGQLLGAPHRIVRNRDTPRAVFRIMWQLIQSDKLAVAYVRNKTADGRGYWVIAVVVPMADGFISVRIKPTSPLFEKVKSLYATLSAAEIAEDLPVEDCEARLLAELSKLGYADYTSFMTAAILAEFRARSVALGPKLKGYFSEGDRIVAGLNAIIKAQGELLQAVESLRDLPTNMRIVASRLEPSGGPLSAMSDIYNTTSAVLFQEIADFALGQNSVSKRMELAFENASFLKAVCLTMAEIAVPDPESTAKAHGVDLDHEFALLREVVDGLEGQERTALQTAERLAQDMNRAAYDLRRSMLGLDTIRVMGLVESGRLGAEGSRIGATMEQIGACHSTIIGLLQGVKDCATLVNAGVATLRMQSQKRQALAAG